MWNRHPEERESAGAARLRPGGWVEHRHPPGPP
eukprot:CAMPEP_0182913280 /NCGR_PEP_ID=MMETSP0034_2-20130328/37958_1 /TAXON_ID=156128 /ORGANISM="Nephroselmis pyriformis, Strain CCMP717" /LENGTH=32 /DNA_ID= /DNA_START= /DNA_END= /DNA_ORIENTATION=